MNMNQRIPNRMKTAAVALLAAGVLAASVAPSSAARIWPPQPSLADYESRVSGFQHHFYRGTQHRHLQDRTGSDMMAVADEAEPMDEAMLYCASRFRSYDPASGTYLGYDGNEHACP